MTKPDDAELSIREAQDQVDRWIKTIGVRYFHELTNLAQLVEEVGEVARILRAATVSSRPKRASRPETWLTSWPMSSLSPSVWPISQASI